MKLWFNSTTDFDNDIRTKYQTLWEQASNHQLDIWQETPSGSVALAIVLDQFPLNMFRGTAKSYSTENQAINVSRLAISKKYDHQLNSLELPFLYMPLMHSEDVNDQNDSVRLFEQAKLDKNIRFAKHHQNIILKFGRFPHRNKALNRTSTAEELEYLASAQAFKG